MDPKVQFPHQFPGTVRMAHGQAGASHGHPLVGPWWLPLAFIWALVLHLRHALYDAGVMRSQKGALPTLVVGNLELGGTGKTPHTLDLAQRLSSHLGADHVAILSRGHGRSTAGFVWANDAATWWEVGDEPWMLQQALPNVHVAVCGDRLEGLRRMKALRPQLKVALLDDGMQHRALRPDLLMVLQSRPMPRRGWGWTRLVPAGPWRDVPARLRSADVHVRPQGTMPPQGLDVLCWERALVSSPPVPWPMPQAQSPLPEATSPFLLVTGTAQPHRILEALQNQKVALAACAHYPDHHPFSKADVGDWLAYGKTHGVHDLLTTTKDAVRLADHLDNLKDWKVWVLPAQIEWTQPDEVEAYLKSWLDSLPS